MYCEMSCLYIRLLTQISYLINVGFLNTNLLCPISISIASLPTIRSSMEHLGCLVDHLSYIHWSPCELFRWWKFWWMNLIQGCRCLRWQWINVLCWFVGWFMCWSAIGFPSFFLGFYLDAEKMVLFFLLLKKYFILFLVVYLILRF